jgi:signal transduction histidine kinase
MTKENIFESLITLKFKERLYETIYQQNKDQTIKKYNIIQSSILFLLSLVLTIIFCLDMSTMVERFDLKYVMILQFVSNGLITIKLLLTIFISNLKIQRWLTYFSYICISLVFAPYRYWLIYWIDIDIMIICFLFTLESFFRLVIFFLGIIDFMPGLYVQVLSQMVNYGLFYIPVPMRFHFRFSIYACILLLTNVIAYFYTKEQRRSFYYYHSLKNRYEWFKNIIDNMNSGFVVITNGQIQYYNNTFLKFFSDRLIATNSSQEEHESISGLDLDDIFLDIQSVEGNVIESFNDIVNLLSNQHHLVGNNFLFLGTKTTESSSSHIMALEVYGRCYRTIGSEKYEFIFNDVTRSKLNAEFKYKNLFLSKIAHEFKNPLLCICELADQINEEIKSVPRVADILKQIKSLSNYLIILVKDLDYFSQKTTGITKTVENDNVDIPELISFCHDIAVGLIRKVHKENFIKFQLFQDENIPRQIYSDEIKLKQILVNLLSNSVKYTQSGTITLSLTRQHNMLRFMVNDTGKGISDEQKDKLFIPFANEFDKLNKISSGLGLSIVKELAELLGSNIEFESQIGQGSSFWFEISFAHEVSLNQSRTYKSISTVRGIHFSDIRADQYLNDNGIVWHGVSDTNKELLVIIVDDEVITRQSTVRLLNQYLRGRPFNATIVEASDGIECLYKYMLLYKEGKRIDFILSDESMEFMNGSICAEVLWNIYGIRKFPQVPFYILSAYESLNLSQLVGISGTFSKPMRKLNFDEIFNHSVR